MTEKRKEYINLYRENNKDKIKAKEKEYRENHKEDRKFYREDNKDKLRKKASEYSQTLKGKFASYKAQAKTRKIDFTLTLEEFKLFWQQNCYYCNRSIATVGLDRIDSSIGYIVNNVRPCCARCNRMKLDNAEEQWYEDMFTILKHRGFI